MPRPGVSAAVLGCALASGVPPASAQGGSASQTDSIEGRVTDSTGGVLARVQVTVRSPDTLGTVSATANSQGEYWCPGLAPGSYTVVYELAGFKTLRRDGIRIALGFTAVVDVQLAVADVAETV